MERDLPADDLATRLTPEYLDEYRLLPIAQEGGRTVVAHAGRPDPQAVAELASLLGGRIELREITTDAFLAAMQQMRARTEGTAADLIAGLESAPGGAIGDDALVSHDLAELANQAPVIRLVNLLLAEAVSANASDVHLEAHARGLHVRYRIDGVLQDAPSPPANLRAAVVSRLKIMAELDIAERRLPQDGRVRLRVESREVDVRVSTLPTLHGESVVMRLLEAQGRRIQLDELGFADDTRGPLLARTARPQGVLLVTGPTGSGKTTTLYALAEQIRTGREKIVSVEDPVEYELPGVAQVPVHHKAGLTFARALRSILRQDPDVLLVGEMRDAETAEICVQAAMTGHLVLSTLHTNDAPSALVRLHDLGVADYLVASTVEAVLAQRLVRRICDACREPTALDDLLRQCMALDGYAPEVVWRGRGCAGCRGTGFRGRVGIYELLLVDAEVRQEFLDRREANGLRALAIARGMRPLRADGWRQVAAGVTTPDEVLRVTHA